MANEHIGFPLSPLSPFAHLHTSYLRVVGPVSWKSTDESTGRNLDLLVILLPSLRSGSTTAGPTENQTILCYSPPSASLAIRA